MAGVSKVTIYDVAAQVGVSISTVSLAFNNPGRVKPETLQRIIEAAEALGFEPRAEAISRAQRGHQRIGVLAPLTSYLSFARRLNGVLQASAKAPFSVYVHDHDSAATAPSPLLSSLPLTKHLDGIIIMGLPLTEDIAARLHRQRLAVVLVDVVRDDISSVSVDDVGGGGMVARHLLQRGHRRLAFIAEEQASRVYTSPSEQRFTGFAATLRDAGIAEADIVTRAVPHDLAHAHRATLELLDLPEPPTAIFAHDDALAGGVLRAARQRGLRVPGDLAVVGFDDMDLAAYLGLTTVRLPFEESGAVALEILTAHLHDPQRSVRQVTLKLTLIERETT